MTDRKQTASRIPTFTSIAEEAAFWDAHDTTEFEDEWEPVEVEVAQPLGHILSVRLESEAFCRLSAIARTRDVNLVTLAQTWVLEAIERAEATDAVAPDRRITAR